MPIILSTEGFTPFYMLRRGFHSVVLIIVTSHSSIFRSLPFLNYLCLQSIPCHVTMLFCSILDLFQQFIFFIFTPDAVYSISHNAHFHHWLCKSPLAYFILSPYCTLFILLLLYPKVYLCHLPPFVRIATWGASNLPNNYSSSFMYVGYS